MNTDLEQKALFIINPHSGKGLIKKQFAGDCGYFGKSWI